MQIKIKLNAVAAGPALSLPPRDEGAASEEAERSEEAASEEAASEEAASEEAARERGWLLPLLPHVKPLCECGAARGLTPR